MFRASRAFRFSGQRKTWKLHWKDVIFAHGVVTLKDISSVKSPNKTSWVRKGWMLTWKHHLTVWWTYLVSYRYLVTFLTSQWNHLGHLGFQAGGGATGASAAFWAILTLQNATVENCWCAKDVNVQIWQIETNWIQLINIYIYAIPFLWCASCSKTAAATSSFFQSCAQQVARSPAQQQASKCHRAPPRC